MAGLIVCLLQVSVIALITLGVTRWFLSRDARRAELVCMGGILLCATSVLLMGFEVPRAWNFQLHKPVPVMTDAPNPPADSEANVTNGVLAQGLMLQLQTGWALEELRSLSSPENRLGSQLSNYATWMAILCCLAILLRLFVGYRALWQITRTSRPCHDIQTLVAIGELTRAAGLQHAPEIRTSKQLSSPCVGCLQRNVIYVPANFAAWSDIERQTSLAHELTHIRRNDARRRLLAEVILSAIYLHPCANWLRRNLVFAQELATDREASKLLPHPNQYRQGLSMLALRMDSQHNHSVSFGVSVSTNTVVRRIKMLKNTRNSNRGPGWLMLAGFLIASTSALAWNIHADEPQDNVTRIASTSKVGGVAKSPFSREAVKPWEAIGYGSGYAHIRPQEMLTNKDFASQLTMIESVLLGPEPPAAAQGLVQHLESWQSSLDITFDEIPEDQRRDGNKYFVSLGSNRFQLDFAKVVDWTTIAESVQLRPIFPKEHEAVRKLLKSKGQSETLKLSPTAPTKTEPNPTAETLWSMVQGGVITAAFAIPDEIAVDQEYLESKNYEGVELVIYELLQMGHSLGLGIDTAKDPADCHFRLTLALNDSNDIANGKASFAQFKKYVSELEASDDQPENERAMIKKVRTQANAWTITEVQVDNGKPTLMLTGQLPFQALGSL
ncbi:MAG: M56 family metallopeptidase, partial [Planctomycetota bacterium]